MTEDGATNKLYLKLSDVKRRIARFDILQCYYLQILTKMSSFKPNKRQKEELQFEKKYASEPIDCIW